MKRIKLFEDIDWENDWEIQEEEEKPNIIMKCADDYFIGKLVKYSNNNGLYLKLTDRVYDIDYFYNITNFNPNNNFYLDGVLKRYIKYKDLNNYLIVGKDITKNELINNYEKYLYETYPGSSRYLW